MFKTEYFQIVMFLNKFNFNKNRIINLRYHYTYSNKLIILKNLNFWIFYNNIIVQQVTKVY